MWRIDSEIQLREKHQEKKKRLPSTKMQCPLLPPKKIALDVKKD
jgi:hypothetical protein